MSEASWGRRGFVSGLAALAASPALAQPPSQSSVRFRITGAMEQGSLALGSAPPGSVVALDGRPLHVTPQGRFVFAFAYDQTGANLVTVRYPDGGGDSRSFTPAVRKYDERRVNGLPQATVTPDPAETARINREAEEIFLARLDDTPGTDFLTGFDWPAPGILSGVFGSRRINNGVPGTPHYGVDMAAPTGTPIRAPADGMVRISADHFLNGGFTLLDHGQGVTTAYLHQSRRRVAAGEAVRRGQVIGEIGQTGRATGPHLHWAMNWFQMRLDPSRSTKTPKPQPL